MPFIICWKGHLAEGKTDARPIIQLDVLPTALAAAGIKQQSKLDGVNLLPFLTGRRSGRPHEALFWRLGEHMAIRKGDWKLVKTHESRLQAAEPAVFEDLSGRNFTIWQTISGNRKILRRRALRRSEIWVLSGNNGTKNLQNHCGDRVELLYTLLRLRLLNLGLLWDPTRNDFRFQELTSE